MLFVFFGSVLLAQETVYAHSHHHTYIVEQAPPPIVVVQQAPPPVVVVQQVQTPLPANADSFESPPADLIEPIPAAPGESYSWQKGHWQWNGNWVWVAGQWALRPQGHTVYVPGYWKLSTHHHRWQWVEPYWK